MKVESKLTFVELISIKKLTLANCKELNDSILEKLVLDIIETEDLEDFLSDEDYQIWEMKIDNKNYIAYHGFPGDNPQGAFIGDNGEDYHFGEAIKYSKEAHDDNHPFSKFIKWYDNKTNDGRDYEWIDTH